MIRLLTFLAAFCAPADLLAQAVVANHAIPSRSIIGPSDVSLVAQAVPGAVASLESIVGKEARVTLYPGRPVREGDIGPPALVDRNQIVTLQYIAGGLSISTDGRVLDRAGEGDRVRVMNLSSRTIVMGRVLANGQIEVGR